MDKYSRFLARAIFNWSNFVKAVLLAAGALWLPFEAYEGLSNNDVAVSFFSFATVSIILGSIVFLLDGFIFSGFLADKVRVNAGPTSTVIEIQFGDLFAENGCYVIGVNDYFCGEIGDERVSAQSLHGTVIDRYWQADHNEWNLSLLPQLVDAGFDQEAQKPGEYQYPIGTAVHVRKAQQTFVFTSLTDTGDGYVMTSSVSNLVLATQAALRLARQKCSGEKLIVPLLGSGLARVGLSSAIILEVILAAIVEEICKQKVTNHICIVLPFSEYGHINIERVAKDWL